MQGYMCKRGHAMNNNEIITRRHAETLERNKKQQLLLIGIILCRMKRELS